MPWNVAGGAPGALSLDAMVGRITAATLILLAAACSGGSTLFGGGSDSLSYAQYHSLQEGMDARAIMKAFGPPAGTLEQEGKIRGLAYRCQDSTGGVQELRMVFGADEKLEKWALRISRGEPVAAPQPAKKEP